VAGKWGYAMYLTAQEKPKERKALDAILARRSVRAYSEGKIDHITIQTLLEATVHAPTALHEETTVQKHHPTGIDDRQRDHNGEIRKKRSDTLVKTLRDKYCREFAQT
jgi:nitroreductase